MVHTRLFTLIMMVLGLASAPAFSQSDSLVQYRLEVTELGDAKPYYVVGPKEYVKVKTVNGTKVKGRITAISASSFEVDGFNILPSEIRYLVVPKQKTGLVIGGMTMIAAGTVVTLVGLTDEAPEISATGVGMIAGGTGMMLLPAGKYTAATNVFSIRAVPQIPEGNESLDSTVAYRGLEAHFKITPKNPVKVKLGTRKVSLGELLRIQLTSGEVLKGKLDSVGSTHLYLGPERTLVPYASITMVDIPNKNIGGKVLGGIIAGVGTILFVSTNEGRREGERKNYVPLLITGAGSAMMIKKYGHFEAAEYTFGRGFEVALKTEDN